MKTITITVTKSFEVPDHYEAVTLPLGEVAIKIGDGKYLWPDIAYFGNDPIDPYERDLDLDEADKAARELGVSGDWSLADINPTDACGHEQEFLVDEISIIID